MLCVSRRISSPSQPEATGNVAIQTAEWYLTGLCVVSNVFIMLLLFDNEARRIDRQTTMISRKFNYIFTFFERILSPLSSCCRLERKRFIVIERFMKLISMSIFTSCAERTLHNWRKKQNRISLDLWVHASAPPTVNIQQFVPLTLLSHIFDHTQCSCRPA